MSRFSIRDLLWLTLVVAIGLGWFIRERQLRAEVTQTKLSCDAKYEAQAARSKAWRGRAGALEHAFKKIGWEVSWEFARQTVTVVKRSDDGYRGFPIYT